MAKVRVRKRGKTYSYIFEAGRINGKRKVIEKGGFPSSDTAYTAGVEAYTDWKHGNIGITSERITLSDFAELWFSRKEKDIRDSSYENYGSIIKTKITAFLGSYILQDLTPAIVESWVQQLYTRGYSKNHIRQCRMLLKAILDYAVHPCGLIPSNPCVYVKIPKNAPTGVVPRVVVPMSRYRELMSRYPRGHYIRIAIVLLYQTGMRMGEVLGLTWEDIDFKSQSLTIDKQRINTSRGPSYKRLAATKTEKSRRKIFMSAELISELQAEQIRQQNFPIINVIDSDGYIYTHSKGLRLVTDMTPVHLVCLSRKGTPLNTTQLSRCLRKEGLNSHSFRHTQATRLAKAHVPPVTAARRLGHANASITLDLYTHDTDDMQKNAREALEMEQWDLFFST